MCEPIFEVPVKIDLDAYRKELFEKKPKQVDNELELEIAKQSQYMHEVAPSYNVLPLVSNRNEHLRPTLSIKNNPFLRCRWQQFLENKPTGVIHIRLYMDYKDSLKTPHRTKLRLNGKFYGVDNKLAPIPVSPDPRNLKKFRHCEVLNQEPTSKTKLKASN